MTKNIENIGKLAISYIRFSSKRQVKQEKIDQQLEQTRIFCAKHGLTLSTDSRLNMYDLGVSAFKGKNLAENSNLNRFLMAVNDGKIAPGSTLCIENVDRLSRADPITATGILIQIIKSGVHIGVIATDTILNQETIKKNPELFQACVSVLIRSHEESATKSNRTGKGIVRMIEKVKAGLPTKLGAYGPIWIKYNSDKQSFIIDEIKANIIKQIFNLYLNGMGTSAIVKYLKEHKVNKYNDTVGRQAPWRSNTIRGLLQNKQVIGCVSISGIEYPAYVPTIISVDDFNKVQVALAKNTCRHGNHSGEVRNLFNSIIYCSECKNALGVHGSPYKHTFFCMYRKEYGCKQKHYVDVDLIEPFIFAVLLNKAPSILLADNSTDTARQVEALKNELSLLNKKRTKTLELLNDETTSTSELKPILADIKTKTIDLDKRLLEAKVKHNTQRTMPSCLNDFLKLIGSDLSNVETRKNIKNLMPSIVKRIEVNLDTNDIKIQMPNDTWIEKKYLTDEQAEEIEKSFQDTSAIK